MTASSKLQHLDLSGCKLPAAAVWQHIFPAGRQLPHLQTLKLADVKQPVLPAGLLPAAAPEGTRLVSCCPALQHLDMQGLCYSRGLVSALQGLTGLHTLMLKDVRGASGDLKSLSQLTGLRELKILNQVMGGNRLLLQLTKLQQLTSLHYQGRPNENKCFRAQVGWLLWCSGGFWGPKWKEMV